MCISVVGVKIWNSIESNIVDAESLCKLKKMYKNYIGSGYSPQGHKHCKDPDSTARRLKTYLITRKIYWIAILCFQDVSLKMMY